MAHPAARQAASYVVGVAYVSGSSPVSAEIASIASTYSGAWRSSI
jgi:hypothetical protein